MADVDLDLPIGSIDGLAENYLAFYADDDFEVTYQVDLHRLVADCPDISLEKFELTIILISQEFWRRSVINSMMS